MNDAQVLMLLVLHIGVGTVLFFIVYKSTLAASRKTVLYAFIAVIPLVGCLFAWALKKKWENEY